MYLRALKEMTITSDFGEDKINIKSGETIHTENSHKFKKQSIETFGMWAGLKVEKIYNDDNLWFSLVHYKK